MTATSRETRQPANKTDLRFCSFILYSSSYSGPLDATRCFFLHQTQNSKRRPIPLPRLTAVQSSTEVLRTSEDDWIWTIVLLLTG